LRLWTTWLCKFLVFSTMEFFNSGTHWIAKKIIEKADNF
jgi:hypothetical protein